MSAEADRLKDAYGDWVAWGPYLSERQWGTVREDYSDDGNAWDYLSHDHARSRAYRWGEDGLAGISDDRQILCFSLGIWNNVDPIAKERLFGLTNGQGNHGEDVKEVYYYLDATPTHSFMRYLYKYPQRPFPYNDLVNENERRKADPGALEYELVDTGVFDDDRYFDVEVVYAKANARDVCVRVTVHNRGPDDAPIDVFPTLWFRNQWRWYPGAPKPSLRGMPSAAAGGVATVAATPAQVPPGVKDPTPYPFETPMALYADGPDDLLFAENETNKRRLWQVDNDTVYVKDGIHDHVVFAADTVNPALEGTKAAARWHRTVPAGGSVTFQLRLSETTDLADPFGPTFSQSFTDREAEADAYWTEVLPDGLSEERTAISRQSYAGMIWSKQYYYLVQREWLAGDAGQPKPPPGHNANADWTHLHASNILTMPDCWEYPWFATWDLCFQSVVFSRIDPVFAKNQLLVLAREFLMSPQGAIPAYEWNFSDTNPPLHAWAAIRIMEIEAEMTGNDPDLGFLEDIFRYCLMYFAWWANRKDPDDNDLFSGGFLGLDNISILNRSALQDLESQIKRADEKRRSVTLYQPDGTSWMGMFSLSLVDMALRLSTTRDGEYGRLASKFIQHFVQVADAINHVHDDSADKIQIWNEPDGFYYDVLGVQDEDRRVLYTVGLRSLVGVIALIPTYDLRLDVANTGLHAGVLKRLQSYLDEHADEFASANLMTLHPSVETSGTYGSEYRCLLAFANEDRLRRVLERILDEAEFLSPHGIRGLSKVHENGYTLDVFGAKLFTQYEPAESRNSLFGGNSNWRGPVWFPINFLFIETLRRYHAFFGDDFQVEHPAGSGQQHTLEEIADDLANRMIAIFETDAQGRRPVFGGSDRFQTDPHWKDHLLFYEYFHGDLGAGIGASHQTGWTGLVAELIRQVA